VGHELATATTTDGVTIAWTASGSGPALVLLPGVPFSNVDGEWRIPVLQRAFEALGQTVQLIQYDGRGTGRSQRDVTDLSLEAYLRDLEAVVEAAHVQQVVLLGFYHSVTHAIAWVTEW
jgi:pimeloyl-ACP methyl ester carboxylesterase